MHAFLGLTCEGSEATGLLEIHLCADVPTGCIRAVNLRVAAGARAYAVLLPAGTVHSLRDTVVFEVQQNSDVTFRLDDWDRIDARTGRRRPLQVARALACVTFPQGAISLPESPAAMNEFPSALTTPVDQWAVAHSGDPGPPPPG